MNQSMLISNGFISLPERNENKVGLPASEAHEKASVATIVSNMAYYGYIPSKEAFAALRDLTPTQLGYMWQALKPVFAKITGDDRKMDEHIVYKNFPKEVLSMEEGDWIWRQVLIYYGMPYDWVAEVELPREPLGDIQRLKVLALADENTPKQIIDNLIRQPNRWTDNQNEWMGNYKIANTNAIMLSDYGFKENGIATMTRFFNDRVSLVIDDATDVLRLCSSLSGQDVSLREMVTFRPFKRAERRRLLSILEDTKNIADDMALRPEVWKRLMQKLRPGDYAFPKVSAAYDAIYNKRVKSFAALVDPQTPDISTLDTVAKRPGEFLRRFHKFYGLFGSEAVDRFIPVMEKLKSRQLVNFRAYINSINERLTLVYAPKSNWSRVQIADNNKSKITKNDRDRLDTAISAILSARLAEQFPDGLDVDTAVRDIKLQTNDQKLAEYGRGTSFDIPETITFIRTASYWEQPTQSVTWFDNGWNFFDTNWKSKGNVAWNHQNYGKGAAIMSGDPVNIKDLRGRGCQMIDLYFDKLLEKGVRFAVWNILCFSRVKFSDAKEVLATLQMGDHAEKGKVYEPSRAQMVFPLKSASYTCYPAYIDLEKRKVVYMDAPLRGSTNCAGDNAETLTKVMPAYVEYLDSLPSLYDAVKDAKAGTIPVWRSDSGLPVDSERAFVFEPVNTESEYTKLAITDLI